MFFSLEALTVFFPILWEVGEFNSLSGADTAGLIQPFNWRRIWCGSGCGKGKTASESKTNDLLDISWSLTSAVTLNYEL